MADVRVDTMECIVAMLRKHGLRATMVSVQGDGISVDGVVPLPATPEESVYEGNELKARQERIAEDKRLLGLG